MSAWSLTTVRLADGGRTVAAVRTADGRYFVPDVIGRYPGLYELLQDWDSVAEIIRNLDPAVAEEVRADEMLSVQHPRKVLCVGANYRDHLAEMGVTELPEGLEPYFFMIPPTTALIGDGQDIVLGPRSDLRPDWEAEVAVVIGRGGANIPEDEALSHVAGYACFDDVTARGLLRRPQAFAPPFEFDWSGSKGRDTFAPLGAMTPSWQIDDLNDLGVRCYVNGVKKQDGNTRDLIVGIPALIAAASASWRLEPGDIITTGTPAGVGHARGEQLTDGDEVRVEIDGFAPLVNRVCVTADVPAALV